MGHTYLVGIGRCLQSSCLFDSPPPDEKAAGPRNPMSSFLVRETSAVRFGMFRGVRRSLGILVFPLLQPLKIIET